MPAHDRTSGIAERMRSASSTWNPQANWGAEGRSETDVRAAGPAAGPAFRAGVDDPVASRRVSARSCPDTVRASTTLQATRPTARHARARTAPLASITGRSGRRDQTGEPRSTASRPRTMRRSRCRWAANVTRSPFRKAISRCHPRRKRTCTRRQATCRRLRGPSCRRGNRQRGTCPSRAVPSCLP